MVNIISPEFFFVCFVLFYFFPLKKGKPDWHLKHPKSIVYLRVHSGCWTFYSFGLTYNAICATLQFYIEYFHYYTNPLYSTYSTPLPWLLAATDLLIVSKALSFPECHRIEIIQRVDFSDWLLSWSNIHLSLLRVFSWLDSSSVFCCF